MVRIPSCSRQFLAGIGLLSALTGMADFNGVSAQEFGGSRDAGKLIYDLRCARCHGPKGGGDGPQAGELIVRPADFHDRKLADKSDEQLLANIEFGMITSPMHAWRGRLSAEEMRDVLAYIRHLSQSTR